jgi:hypothetical protein
LIGRFRKEGPCLLKLAGQQKLRGFNVR